MTRAEKISYARNMKYEKYCKAPLSSLQILLKNDACFEN